MSSGSSLAPDNILIQQLAHAGAKTDTISGIIQLHHVVWKISAHACVCTSMLKHRSNITDGFPFVLTSEGLLHYIILFPCMYLFLELISHLCFSGVNTGEGVRACLPYTLHAEHYAKFI